MKILNQIFKDIKSGKNISTYIFIIYAIFFAIIKFFKLDYFTDIGIQTIILSVLIFILINKIQKKWILNDQTEILNIINKHIVKPKFDILESWSSNQLYDRISKTTKNIVLVQSWFPDASIISDKLLTASKNNKINIEFYIMDPNSPFGSQRWMEVNKRFEEKDKKISKQEFQLKFNNSVSDIINRLNGIDNISYQIYTYDTLPTLKFYRIDERDYYFGWLGLDANSTNNVCFHLSDDTNSPESNIAIDKIDNHLTALKSNSKIFKKSA